MTAPVLEAADLSFSYGRFRRHQVFTNLDWVVTPGETTLLLGPNGAGKSTLLKLLSGFEVPDSGQVRIAGKVDRRELCRSVGWMPQDVQPGRGLTVIEQLEYVAWVGGASRRDARQSANRVIVDVDLQDKRDVRVDRLSGGQLRRVGLGQALVRRAPVLLLDEPTAGLDPAQSLSFRRLLQELDCPGGIVISTHQVHDLSEDVDRVAVIAAGRVQFEGTEAELRQHGSASYGSDVSLAEAFAQMVGGGRH